MKTVFKILVILVAAVLVGGLFYGVVAASSSSAAQQAILERLTDREFPADGSFARPDREETNGIQFPVDALKNLAIISVVSVIYLNVAKWLGRRKPKAVLSS
jgi:hypothetical protein